MKYTDENAVYVRQMYRQFADGVTVEDIARGLEGVENSRGKP